jgi:pentapeptide MXKDX repeat protein
MKKMIAVVFACCIPLVAGGAYAQDMKKDEMKKEMMKGDMKKDAMGTGEMKKEMKKDAMGKDEMMKDMNKGGMKKDEKGMMKEEMKK